MPCQSASFDLAFAMLEPETQETILSLVECVNSAAKRACHAIDEQDPHHEVKCALQKLRQAIQSVKSDTMMYKVLIAIMKDDPNSYGRPTFAIFISRYVKRAWVDSFTPTIHGLQLTDKMDEKKCKASEQRSKLRSSCLRRTRRAISTKSRSIPPEATNPKRLLILYSPSSRPTFDQSSSKMQPRISMSASRTQNVRSSLSETSIQLPSSILGATLPCIP